MNTSPLAGRTDVSSVAINAAVAGQDGRIKIKRTCMVCDGPHEAFGLCNKHYQMERNRERPVPTFNQLIKYLRVKGIWTW